jgi:hypothetical protein
VRVGNAAGTDSTFLYYLEYQAYGVTLRYEIGNRADLIDRFPGGGEMFGNVRTFPQTYDDKNFDGLYMGSAEELYGTSESLGARLERGLRELGIEDLPAWMKADRQVMTILLEGSKEGWSPGRILTSMSGTQAFKNRFPYLDKIQEQLGGTGTLDDAVTEWLRIETKIRDDLRKYRGPDTDLSSEYIAGIIGSGWTETEVSRVLEGEFRMKQNPGAFENLNEILAYQGMDPVDPAQFLDIISGRAPAETIGTINDAIRMTALEQQGIDIAPSLAAALGEDGELDLIPADELAVYATEAAQNLLRNRMDLAGERYGLSRDDVVKAAFGEERSTQVDELLLRLARERQMQSRLAAPVGNASTGYIDQLNRLRLQGMGGL